MQNGFVTTLYQPIAPQNTLVLLPLSKIELLPTNFENFLFKIRRDLKVP